MGKRAEHCHYEVFLALIVGFDCLLLNVTKFREYDWCVSMPGDLVGPGASKGGLGYC